MILVYSTYINTGTMLTSGGTGGTGGIGKARAGFWANNGADGIGGASGLIIYLQQ